MRAFAQPPLVLKKDVFPCARHGPSRDETAAAVAAAEVSASRRRAGFTPGDRVSVRQMGLDTERDLVLLDGALLQRWSAVALVTALACRLVDAANEVLPRGGRRLTAASRRRRRRRRACCCAARATPCCVNIVWPDLLGHVFFAASFFNFNIDLIAPECAAPSYAYPQKWLTIEALPREALPLLR